MPCAGSGRLSRRLPFSSHLPGPGPPAITGRRCRLGPQWPSGPWHGGRSEPRSAVTTRPAAARQTPCSHLPPRRSDSKSVGGRGPAQDPGGRLIAGPGRSRPRPDPGRDQPSQYGYVLARWSGRDGLHEPRRGASLAAAGSRSAVSRGGLDAATPVWLRAGRGRLRVGRFGRAVACAALPNFPGLGSRWTLGDLDAAADSGRAISWR